MLEQSEWLYVSEGCAVGEYFYNETAQCERCPLASYNDQVGATSCTSCATGSFTDGDGKTSSSDCWGQFQLVPQFSVNLLYLLFHFLIL